jgi:DNA helicase-2/ATP-dependent DNA helicase PcrA
VSAYPATSGIDIAEPTGDDWPLVYAAASRLLRTPIGHRIVSATYGGVFVDEYQDCTLAQHEFVKVLSSILPTRVLGDPLQGIFSFKGTPTVDWLKEVVPAFEPLEEPSTPWRWRINDRNHGLGDWLVEVRRRLVVGEEIGLQRLPPGVHWEPMDHQTVASAARRLRENQRTTVVVRGQPQQCRSLAKRLPGLMVVEAVECSDLQRHAGAIDGAVGTELVELIRDFAKDTMTGMSAFQTVFAACIERREAGRRYKHQVVLEALKAVRDAGRPRDLRDALVALREHPETRLYRAEMHYSMERALLMWADAEGCTLSNCCWTVRDRMRRGGRRIPMFATATTLLVKGLEFDNVLLVDGDTMSAKHLYVALTRASRKLTIVSSEPVLRPRK